MKEEKIKKLIIILLIILAVFLCVFKFSGQNDNLTGTDLLVLPEKVADEPQYIATGIKTDAYDYIITVMAEPEFWEDDIFETRYAIPWEKNAADIYWDGRDAARTGWTLLDENTASFQRGYMYSSVINFSDHVFETEDMQGNGWHLDFKNLDFYEFSKDSKKQIEYEINQDGIIKFSIAGQYRDGKYYEFIEKIFNDYENVFESFGCPLLEMPKGTLGKYKGKTAVETEKCKDGLIHAIWERDGFKFDFIENCDINWLGRAEEIDKAPAPDSDVFVTEKVMYEDKSVHNFDAAVFSPRFLVVTDKNNFMSYQADGMERSYTEAIAYWWLSPIINEIYGYDGVYFIDSSNLTGIGDPKAVFTKEEFNKGFAWDALHNGGLILSVLKGGNEYVRNKASVSGGMEYLVSDIKDLCSFYNLSYPYADDFFENTKVMYDTKMQHILGLM